MTSNAGASLAVPEPLWATDRWRWMLLAVAITVLAAFPTVATHPKSLGDLRDAVAAGSVTQVWVADALPAGASGFATAEVRWRQGGITHAAQVVQVSDVSVSAPMRADAAERVVGDVRGYLRGLPGAGGDRLVIEDASRTGGASVLGWRVPLWLTGTALALWVLAGSLVVAGPAPWRASRWAWFWFVAGPVGFVGLPAFLALGGRLPWGRREPPRPRLTGGWAFAAVCLLTLVINPSWPT